MADKKISQLSAATTPLAGTEVLPIVQSGSTVKVSVANLTAGRSTSVGFLDVAATAGKVGNLNTTNANGLYLTGQTNGTSRWDFGSAKQVFNAGTEADFGLGTRGGYLALGVNAEHLKIASGGNATVTTGNLVVGTAAKGIDFSANAGAAGMTSELLNWYEEGTWTPTDASGASLTFTSPTGRYTRVGNVVFLFGFVQYPVTASGANASIGGLPFTVNSNSSALQGAVTYSQVATVRSIGVNPSTTNTTVYTFAGAAVTNATLSGTVLYFNSTYFV